MTTALTMVFLGLLMAMPAGALQAFSAPSSGAGGAVEQMAPSGAGAAPAGVAGAVANAGVGPSSLAMAGCPLTCQARLALPSPQGPAALSSQTPNVPATTPPVWRQVCATCSPGARIGDSLAYDPTLNAVLMFGGYNGGPMSDTWTYASGTWTQLSPANVPPARYDAVMAFDVVDNTMVMFGGYGATSAYLSDTWEFRGGNWVQMNPTTSPPGRFLPGMTYDATQGEVILFGGSSSTGFMQDTWGYVGGNWTSLTTSVGTPPSARANLGFEYDANDSADLLFGGWDNSGPGLADTWELTSGGWSQLSPVTSPPGRQLANEQMAYDPGTRYMFIFSGESSSYTMYTDTWAWTGGNWVQQFPLTNPSGRAWGSMTYDAFDRYVLVYAGEDQNFNHFADTWNLSTIVPFTALGSVSPNPVDVGGPGSFNGTEIGGTGPFTYSWVYGDGGLNPSHAPNPTHVYNATGTYMAHFWINETAGLMRSREANLTVTVTPLPTVAPAANPSAADAGVLISFTSGLIGGATPVGIAWRYGDGGAGTGSPATHTYATAGTYLAWVFANDSSIGRASGSVTVTIYPALVSLANAHPLATDAGLAVHFFENVSGGHPPNSWAWTFGDGARTATGNTSHSYASPGSYVAIFWANDTGGAHQHAWFNLTVNALPSVALSVTYATVDVGVTDTFRETTSGGTAPYSYAWRFGDGGSSTGSASPTHAYSATGTYQARGWANDSVGQVATGILTIVVYPALSVTASVALGTLDLGMPDTFTATVTGGAPPQGISWAFGDGYTGSGASITHTYLAVGSYVARLWVNDTGGGAYTTTLPVTVNPMPTVTASASYTTVDAGVSIAFSATATGGTPAFGYAWQFGDGFTSTSASPTHAFAAAGIYQVWVWANDTVGGSASTTVSVVVNPALAATVTPGASWADLGMTTNLAVTPSGGTGPFSYAWSLGDGTSASVPSIGHIYAAAGTYTVNVWVNDSGGGSVQRTATVTVNPALAIGPLTATHVVVDVGHPTVLSATVTGGNATRSYVYGGLPTGCASASTMPLTCTPTATGTFTVTVTVSDGLTSVTSETLVLQVHPDPTITAFTIAPATLTVGRSTLLSTSVAGGTAPFTYAFQGLPAGCSGTSATFSCAPTTAGTYTVTVVASDATGVNATATATMVVNPGPSITSFTAAPSGPTVGTLTTLTVVATGGTGALSYTYTGLPGGCASANTASLTCTPNGTGTFTVNVEVTDAMGVGANQTLSVIVSAAPTTTGGSGSLFSGTSLLLLIVLLVAIVGLVAALLMGRKRRAPPTAAPSSSEPPAAPLAAPEPPAPASAPAWGPPAETAPSPPSEVPPIQQEPAGSPVPAGGAPTSYPPPPPA